MNLNSKANFIWSFAMVCLMAVFGIAFKVSNEKLPANYYPQTLVVVEANHTPEWT